MSCTVITLFNSIANIASLAMEYRVDKFYIDYMENVFSNSSYTDIGSVSTLNEFPSKETAKQITVGDEVISSIEEFYLQNESHNKTTYSFVNAKTAKNTINLTTPISTSAIPVEIIRRHTKADTQELSLASDNQLSFIKCYGNGGLTSEKEERVTINDVPDNFGDLNLCFMPRYVLENNKAWIGEAFYLKSDTEILKFMSSKYRVDIETEFDSVTYNEQTDLIKTDLGEQLFIPINFKCSQSLEGSVIAELVANPNKMIKFDYNGTDYYVFNNVDSDIDSYVKTAEWTFKKATV